MIVRMKKLTLMVASGSESQALGVLRSLGLMHITHMQKPAAHYINYIENRLKNLDKALSSTGESGICKDIAKEEIPKYIKEIIDLDSRKSKLQDRLAELDGRKGWFDIFGDVSGAAVQELRGAGVFLRLYECGKSLLKTIPKDKLVYVVGKQNSQIYVAHLTTDEDDVLRFPQAEVPGENFHSLMRKIHNTEKELEDMVIKLGQLSVCRRSLAAHKKELNKALEFCKVRFGMVETEGIQLLQGFCPKEAVQKIISAAKKEGWAVVAQDPKESDPVPTFIRNPKWVDLIRPVFKFMGTLPGYREYDISFWFLLFFSLFFAMLIGDAGYGFLFLAATFFTRKKLKNLPQQPFFLMYLLSSTTIIWGAVTGTWFGAQAIAQLPIFSSLVVSRIDSFVAQNQNFMIYLCFLIGAIHLSIAHGIVAFRYMNSPVALGQLGWMFIVWAVFFVAGNLVLARALPEFSLMLGAVGVSLVVLFSNPRKNILKGMAMSLADLPLKTISSFSDIVSYLRLFAVGYATVAVASTFNNMALGSGINSAFAALGAAFILFFGHALNVILGLMAVIVHGIRLNMLEFSGHLNMEWSGREYKPFKE